MMSFNKVFRSTNLQKPIMVSKANKVLIRHTWNLAGNCSPNFCFTILEQLHERGNKISSDNFIVHSLRDLRIVSNNHKS